MDDSNKTTPGDVTQLLGAYQRGEPAAGEQLYTLIYDELLRMARRQLARERKGHTLDTAGLVNEAYLRLALPDRLPAEGRAHFYRIASRVMRRILVDHARKRNSKKRGGSAARTSFAEAKVSTPLRDAELIALDDALDQLDTVDTRLRKIVEYRFFAGLSEQEIADLLDVTPRTVERNWAKARAWLYRELARTESASND